MEMVHVESRALLGHGYDAATQTMAVVFNTTPDVAYVYPNVGEEQRAALIDEDAGDGESVGGRIAKFVRKLPFTKVPVQEVFAP